MILQWVEESKRRVEALESAVAELRAKQETMRKLLEIEFQCRPLGWTTNYIDEVGADFPHAHG